MQMKKQIFLVSILFLSIHCFAQLANSSNKDSICGHKIIFDQQHRMLGWYKPETPGASYDKVIRLASEFMLNTPIEMQTGLPMYLVTCCFQGPHMTPQKNIIAEDWANNPACIYSGSVQSLAVLYRVYSGDDSYLKLVKSMLDFQLENGTTPSTFVWPNVPYASADPFSKIYQGATKWEADGMRGDGLHGIEPDKIGELGYAYLRFYEITLDEKYLTAAINCANALARFVRDVRPGQTAFVQSKTKLSPWPFRVNARSGIVIDDYCSNVLEPVKLFDELLRIRSMITLSEEQVKAFQNARQIAWEWLYSINGPMTTFIWNGYFEDIQNDPERANRLQITPIELAKYLVANPAADKNIDTNVPSLIHWVANAFKTEGMDAIKEQTWCYEPMGSHTARYGSVCAMYYERTGDEWYKDQAYRFLNVASYMTYDNGVVAVGPNWPGSWFSDGYADYIRHFLDAMGAIPEWAPAGENHLLKSSSIVRNIRYESSKISFTTFDNESNVLLRLISKPKKITVSDKELNSLKQPGVDGYFWKAFDKGGVVNLKYSNGKEVIIIL
jgi:hypothetical protein